MSAQDARDLALGRSWRMESERRKAADAEFDRAMMSGRCSVLSDSGHRCTREDEHPGYHRHEEGGYAYYWFAYDAPIAERFAQCEDR